MYLGIEIGGTKLQLGVGHGESAVLERLERRQVDANRGAAGILDQIEQAGRELIDANDVSAIGIGFGGPINVETGRVITSHQIDGWDDFPLVQWCDERFGLPVVLGNDCDTAALAEARFGAGRGKQTVFYVTVGTGIGGGLVIDGRRHGGGRPAVAEIGHLRPCGFDIADAHVTVESISSGPGIESTVKAALTRDNKSATDDVAELLASCGNDVDKITAVQIADAARRGNSIANAAIRRGVDCLGWAVAQVVALVAADVVVVGGGVSLMSEDLFFAPLRSAAQRHVFGPLASSFDIVPAELGEEVVVHGAVASAYISDNNRDEARRPI
jgi:glucokinase